MADEITIQVEGEPWTGLIVVQDVRWGLGLQYRYGLVQASEWNWTGNPKDPDREVTVWKGPEKPDEKIKRRDLTEVECRTVLVNKEGFYTCPPIIDQVRDLAADKARKWFDEEANRSAAEAQSYVDSEEYAEKYGNDVMAVAHFGDAYAVNGESRMSSQVKLPKGWVRLKDEGGFIPSGPEEQVDLEYILERVTEEVSEELKRQVDKKDVEEALRKEFDIDQDYVMWTADSGRAEVYIPKANLKAYEKRKEEQETEERNRIEAARTARIKKELEERRQKVRRGGFPRPKDWSPTGETDFTPPHE